MLFFNLTWIVILFYECPRVKKGGSSPVSNTALAALFEKAKELDIPRDIIDRNIKRASEKGQEAYMEKFYEVVGHTSCIICSY